MLRAQAYTDYSSNIFTTKMTTVLLLSNAQSSTVIHWWIKAWHYNCGLIDSAWFTLRCDCGNRVHLQVGQRDHRLKHLGASSFYLALFIIFQTPYPVVLSCDYFS